MFLNSGVLSDAGVITGGAGGVGDRGTGAQKDAVQFGASAATLIVHAGAAFDGDIVANASVADTLVRDGGGAGTLSGSGSMVTEKPDADWTLNGTIGGAGGTQRWWQCQPDTDRNREHRNRFVRACRRGFADHCVTRCSQQQRSRLRQRRRY